MRTSRPLSTSNPSNALVETGKYVKIVGYVHSVKYVETLHRQRDSYRLSLQAKRSSRLLCPTTRTLNNAGAVTPAFALPPAPASIPIDAVSGSLDKTMRTRAQPLSQIDKVVLIWYIGEGQVEQCERLRMRSSRKRLMSRQRLACEMDQHCPRGNYTAHPTMAKSLVWDSWDESFNSVENTQGQDKTIGLRCRRIR